MRVEGVVLAAGLSSRMGDNKLMKTIDHVPMIERVIINLIPFCERIIVVVGHRREDLLARLKTYNKVEIVVNDDYQSGMFSSVKAGCEAVRGDRFFLMPADIPFVKKETYEVLLQTKGDIVIPSVNHHGGHPILLKASVVSGIGASQAEHFRAFLAGMEKTYVCVEDRGVLIDIDTPEDYAKYVEEGCE